MVAAPAPQQNTIDFLLDLNQDVLDKEEVQASVKPISQAQVGTTTERNAGREPAPVFEAQADVQEIPRESGPTASQLNKDREEVEDQEDRDDQQVQEEDGQSNSEDDSEQKDQQSDSKDDQDQDQDQDSKDNEQDRQEDTTIRVYGPEDENDENDESLQQKEHQDSQQENQKKIEPEVQRQPQQDIRQPQEDSRPVQIDPRQPEVQISQHADTVKQFDEVVDQRGTDLLQEIDQVTIPEVISEQPDSLDAHQEIEVKPDQLFNHGSIVLDKTTFADGDLPSTTPFSNKKWNHDHGPPAGFGPWHPKFPGGFPGHPHGDESGRPPFFGMPPFNGPPPRFDGPPHWHFHNHSDDHRDWHHHDHDHDHGFHGHGFHRGGPWNWNRS